MNDLRNRLMKLITEVRYDLNFLHKLADHLINAGVILPKYRERQQVWIITSDYLQKIKKVQEVIITQVLIDKGKLKYVVCYPDRHRCYVDEVNIFTDYNEAINALKR